MLNFCTFLALSIVFAGCVFFGFFYSCSYSVDNNENRQAGTRVKEMLSMESNENKPDPKETEIREKVEAIARILEGTDPSCAANIVCTALNTVFTTRYGRVATVVYRPAGYLSD